MSQNTASERTSDSQNSSIEREWSIVSELEGLAKNGVFMTYPGLNQRSSEELCSSYLQGNRVPKWWPSYPPDKIPTIINRMEELNEARIRIRRDIMPLVVPSAENLFYCGEPIEDWIGDDIQAEWTRPATMGGTRPKPDYTAGLLREAFTEDEKDKLRNYCSPLRPFLFTAELSFPFLICEARSGEVGFDEPDRKNIHSASIAVRAIIELYREAFGESDPDRVNKLYGQVLVFTITHNHYKAQLHGHYAVFSEDFPDKLKFYRYEIEFFSLTCYGGRDRFKSYNFVQNVYEKFAPEHRKRIKDAVAHLKSPGERTGLSFPASLALEESDSQANSQQTLLEPMSSSQLAILQKENERLRYEVDLLRQQRQLQEQQRQQQEQLRQQMEQNEEQLRQQLEQTDEQLRQQLRQQLEQNEEQYKEVIKLLREQKPAKG